MPKRLSRRAAWLALVAAVTLGPLSATESVAASSTAPRPIRHVFVIVLENEGYSATFGNPSADPYLATTLPSQGALLRQYYGIGHESNDNYIAMISGQAPNPQTQADCQIFSDFVGSGPVVPPGQAAGSGCVFPASVATVANQLASAHLTWKAYLQDMGNIATREPAVCGHPAIGTRDGTESAVAGDGYATRHNPFVYFHSIIDSPSCNRDVVPLGSTSGALPASAPKGTTGLATDLRSLRTTPNLTFIVPNLCTDGHDYPCVNQPSGTSALADIDTFLSTWVPMIQHSPAYVKDGLLAVVFDEAASSDASSCCNETPGPNSASPGITGMGGGRTGAVLLSPSIVPGTVSDTPFNHYALLGSIEDIFALPRLGEAQTVTSTFGTGRLP